MQSPCRAGAVSADQRTMICMGKVLYTARVRTVGGRGGASRSTDGRLDIQLSAFDGAGSGTNPEQLLAAGWSACFLVALRTVAGQLHMPLPDSTAIDAEVDLIESGDLCTLDVRLTVALPGIEPESARQLVSA